MRISTLEDIRKDEECADTVGVYLQVDEQGKAHIRMTLGPEVQTLTRAMTAILCKGLDGCTPQEILDLPSDFVTRIVGANWSAFAARRSITCSRGSKASAKSTSIGNAWPWRKTRGPSGLSR